MPCSEIWCVMRDALTVFYTSYGWEASARVHVQPHASRYIIRSRSFIAQKASYWLDITVGRVKPAIGNGRQIPPLPLTCSQNIAESL